MKGLRKFLPPLLAGGLVFAILAATYTLHQNFQSSLGMQIIKLQDDVSALKKRINDVHPSDVKTNFPIGLIWRAPSKPDASLALQDAIVKIVSKEKLTLNSFGSANLTRNIEHDIVAFELEAEGPLPAIYELLAELENIEPRVAVGRLYLRTSRNVGKQSENIQVLAQITLWAFWEEGT